MELERRMIRLRDGMLRWKMRRGKEILAGFMRGACDASEGGKNASESFNVNVLRM